MSACQSVRDEVSARTEMIKAASCLQLAYLTYRHHQHHHQQQQQQQQQHCRISPPACAPASTQARKHHYHTPSFNLGVGKVVVVVGMRWGRERGGLGRGEVGGLGRGGGVGGYGSRRAGGGGAGVFSNVIKPGVPGEWGGWASRFA